MPRIRQYTRKYAKEDFLREIREKQGRHNLMQVKALAEATGIPYCTLRRRLMEPDNLTASEIRKLNAVLHIDLEKLAQFLGYSHKEIAYIQSE